MKRHRSRPSPRSVTPDSPGPMYLHISEDLIRRIDQGDFAGEGQLPSYTQLCSEYKVSEITARRAISLLREHGRVYTEKGRGIFVRQTMKYRLRVLQPRTFSAAEAGHDPVAFVLFDLYDGIRQKAEQLGAEIVRCSRIRRSADTTDGKPSAGGARREGWLFLHEQGLERELSEAGDRRLPYVVVEGLSPRYNRVAIDMEAGCRKMMRYLQRHGHTQIAFLSRPDTNPWYAPRHRAYRSALQEGGATVNPELIGIVEGYDPVESDALVAHWLRMPASARPTAIFAANDLIAVHVLDYLKLRRVRVPQDLSIVGYDNAPESGETDPPLTTVDAPRHEAGEEAVVQLIRLIDKHQTKVAKVLRPRLVVRDSVRGI